MIFYLIRQILSLSSKTKQIFMKSNELINLHFIQIAKCLNLVSFSLKLPIKKALNILLSVLKKIVAISHKT